MALVDLKSNLSTAFKKAPVDAFPDKTSGAKGFTENFTDPNNTQFIGVKGRQYIYPVTVTGIHRNSVMEVATVNSRFDSGIAKLNNQLGNGSPFHYVKGGTKTVKTFSNLGYSEGRTYISVVNSGGSILGSKASEQNSPSAIEEQYKKYNLRDEAFNFQYMRHPLILRGIQRKGNEKPQRWGVDALTNFDDGLIRGGATTAAERLAIDTARIAKWMASPRGLLWIVKQAGLGLTNPKVETNPIIPLPAILKRQTRVHTGLASLLSVAGSPLGLHFTRHGIPFINEAASYGKVQSTKTLLYPAFGIDNRLVSLRNSLIGNPNIGKASGLLGFFNRAKTLLTGAEGLPILELSGLAGPNSVYGIGATTITRTVKSSEDALKNAYEYGGFKPVWGIGNQYASGYVKNKYKSGRNDVNRNDNKKADTLKESSFIGPQLPGESRESLSEKLKNYSSEGKPLLNPKFNKSPGNELEVDLSTSKTLNAASPYKNETNPPEILGSYMTLAYNKLKKRSKDTIQDLKGDFRNAFKDDKKGYTGYRKDSDYTTNNLETKYGFGELGKPGADRTNPDEFLVKSNAGNDKFDGTNANRFALSKLYKTTFRGDVITAIDRSSQKEKIEKNAIYPENVTDLIEFYFEDGDMGYSVMPFRAIITGLSDSFSPGWNRIDIMGRPDGAYLYSSFERSLSFTFTVAALSRSEMIPMWRKLNYLASYTMPDFNSTGGRPNGPFMRLTIGDMFKNCPGFLESLTYTVPDEATWDIAHDRASGNKDAKQLPTSIEASVTFKVIHDFRPQLHGQVYYLNNEKNVTGPGNWLMDYEGGSPDAYKKADDEKSTEGASGNQQGSK